MNIFSLEKHKKAVKQKKEDEDKDPHGFEHSCYKDIGISRVLDKDENVKDIKFHCLTCMREIGQQEMIMVTLIKEQEALSRISALIAHVQEVKNDVSMLRGDLDLIVKHLNK